MISVLTRSFANLHILMSWWMWRVKLVIIGSGPYRCQKSKIGDMNFENERLT